jgi:tRNA-2-methylthio-N6-dimethylallyladenosine synthase
MAEKTFYIKTFGCQMNLRDSEIMAQTLSSRGFVETMTYQEADLVILNTCSIRAKAEQKVLSLLGYLRKAKAANPSMRLVVAGCVAQQEGMRLVAKMPHIDLVIGTQHIYNLPEYLHQAQHGGSRVITMLVDDYCIPQFLPDPKRAPAPPPLPHPANLPLSRFVTIMQGCNNFCSYCVVPYTRGREVSRNFNEIIDEVRILVEQGIKEVTLLGQNVNSYGMTNAVGAHSPPYSFPQLLRAVGSIEGLARLRFTTSNPKDFSEELMRCFKDLKNLCPQLHLPVQSGSDRILKLMNRHYTRKEYLEKVDMLRSYCPTIALTTDIIVGFPGENEHDFEETMALLETVRFQGSFSFKYSDRPGTKASQLTDKVEERIQAARLQYFQARQDEISLERNREYLGTSKRVLIEEICGSDLRGRTDTNHIVHIKDCRAPVVVGDFHWVRILHAGQHSLQGELSEDA